jgi:hypothetical protein
MDDSVTAAREHEVTELVSFLESATQTPGKGLGRNLIAQRSRSGVGNLSRPSMAVSCADEQSS